jgi:hypothetical protein
MLLLHPSASMPHGCMPSPLSHPHRPLKPVPCPSPIAVVVLLPHLHPQPHTLHFLWAGAPGLCMPAAWAVRQGSTPRVAAEGSHAWCTAHARLGVQTQWRTAPLPSAAAAVTCALRFAPILLNGSSHWPRTCPTGRRSQHAIFRLQVMVVVTPSLLLAQLLTGFTSMMWFMCAGRSGLCCRCPLLLLHVCCCYCRLAATAAAVTAASQLPLLRACC